MPSHKITFEFESTTGAAGTAGSKSGWSESWYENADRTDVQAAFSATVLAAARRRVLTTGWQLPSIRVSRLDVNNNLLRRGQLIFVPPADAPGFYGGANIDEQPYDALEISIATTAGHSRHFAMRGIGNDVVSPGARFLNPPQFANNFAAFAGTLLGQQPVAINGPWAVRYRTIVLPIGAPASGIINISAVDITTGGANGGTPASPLVTAQGGIDLTGLVGSTIVIQNVLGMRSLNGSWKVLRVVGVGNVSIQLAPKRRVTVSGVYALSGFLRGYTYQLDNIVNVTPGYGTSRRTGRPLQLVRGRRSNRVS
jgi:hypothetical protein